MAVTAVGEAGRKRSAMELPAVSALARIVLAGWLLAAGVAVVAVGAAAPAFASGGGDAHGGGGGEGGKPKPKPKPKADPDCLWNQELVVKIDELSLAIPKDVVRRPPPPRPALVERHVVFIDKVALRLKITTPEGVLWVFPLTRMALPEIRCEGFIVGEPLMPLERGKKTLSAPPWANR